MTAIELRADESSSETVGATDLGDGRFQLEETPVFLCRLRLGDVVQLRPAGDGTCEVVKLLKRPLRHYDWKSRARIEAAPRGEDP